MSTLKVENKELLRWVADIQKLTNPKDVHWCTGSREEADGLLKMMIEGGSCIKLTKRENSYYFRSDPSDTARVESKTFICSATKDDAGPLNNWRDPVVMRNTTKALFTNAFEGRTMYVLAFSMGPFGSELSQLCVQITDSPYVVVNARILTRMGQKAIDAIGPNGHFVHLLHATTNNPETAKKIWPCEPDKVVVAHFPDAKNGEEHVISFGSGYGGNALAKKSCLRLATIAARNEGWLAEHMLILGVKNLKTGNKTYLTGAFPSSCGKTALSTCSTVYPGDFEVTTVGDDMAWIKVVNGKLFAVNAENGFFGVAPGTNTKTNPSAAKIFSKDSLFTNTALFADHSDIWFENGDTEPPAEGLLDWRGEPWTPGCGRLAAHPNSRFTSPLVNCPILDSEWDNPSGVPIGGIIYGGRRSVDIPVVFQSPTYLDGIYAGLTVSSEMTAAQEGTAGTLRTDPYSNRPFLAYHVGDYVNHLIKTIAGLKVKPLFFHVNWFRRDPSTKKFLWPGFSQNSRILKWMEGRINSSAGGTESPLGIVPRYEDIDWTGLDYTKEQWEASNTLDPINMRNTTLLSAEGLFLQIGRQLPQEMHLVRALLALKLDQ